MDISILGVRRRVERASYFRVLSYSWTGVHKFLGSDRSGD